MDGKSKKIFIQKYLKDDVLKKRGAWPREMKIFNTLSSNYLEDNFWNWYNPGFKLNSLAWFLGDGKPEIERAYGAFKFDLQGKTNKVEPTQIAESVQGDASTIHTQPIMKSKPKTLSAWLKK